MKRSILLALAIACLCTGCGGGSNTTIINKTVTESSPESASHPVLAADTYKPTGKWCPTNRACFDTVKWPVYDSSHAVGSGSATEGGAGLASRHYPELQILLSRPRMVCGAVRFTRASIPESEFAVRYALGAVGCQGFVYQPNGPLVGSASTAPTAPTTPSAETAGQPAGATLNCGSIHNVGPNHADAFSISVVGLTCAQADSDLRGGILTGHFNGPAANGFACKSIGPIKARCTSGNAEITYNGD